MEAIAGPESDFATPNSQLILRIYAAMNGLGGGAKTEFAPDAETLGTPLVSPTLC